ncbi:ribonuclease H-like domain-containing protein [Mycena polygramma]|nr:ribonuclease H-like domain-containing protein [Mycena polygramma]
MRGLYLPNPKLSVTNLATFELPPMASTAAEYKLPQDHSFFSEDPGPADPLLAHIQVPYPSLIAKITAELRQQYLGGAESICIPWTGQKVPIWSPELWSILQLTVKPNVEAWTKAIEWLMKLERQHPREVRKALQSLAHLAWSGSIQLDGIGSLPPSSGEDVDSLTVYLSRKWFSSRQIDQMMDVFLYEIRKARPELKIEGMSVVITTEILAQYSKSPRDYDPKADHFLQRFGRSLQSRPDLVGTFHVNENHWVSTCMDLVDEAIEFGDPGGGEPDDVNVCDALEWFVRQHLPSPNTTAFETTALLCTQQRDTYNCGLHAPHAIGHKYLPDKYPLIGADLELGDLGRIKALRNVISKFHESRRLDQYMNTSPSKRYSRSPSPPLTPRTSSDQLSNAMRSMSVSPRKEPAKRRRVDGSSGSGDVAPIFKRMNSKAGAKKSVAKVAVKQRDADLAAMPDDVSDEEIDLDSKPAAGRPRLEALDRLTVELKGHAGSTVRRYRCAGTKCPQVFKPRTLSRVLKHAKRCLKLTAQQRQFASTSSAATSPGARAEELAKGLPSAEPDAESPGQLAPFFGAAGAKQVQQHSGALLDLAIVKLFCAAGLPPNLADYPEYKEVLRLAALAGRYYEPAGRTILMDNHIMSEQEHVRNQQIAYLRTQTRLTLSFDGGDVRLGETLYTFHASNADGRSFLLEGLECTGVPHTAQWMANAATEAMAPIGVERFGGVSSDDTGNTKGCRGILCDKFRTLLNLPDPNHHLSLTCRDILLLPYFKLTIKILRGTIKHFSQSRESKKLLKDTRLREGIGRGLETIGKTRFATVTWSGISLRRNLNPIRSLVTTGLIEVKKYNEYFLISVTEGIAKAIQCLEAQSCNPADVYLLWLAVTAHIRATLRDSMIPEDVCNEIRGIINYRWNQFFVTNSGHGAYPAAFYLNPNYVNSSIFKQPNAVAPPTITIPGTGTPDVPIGVKNAKIFTSVGEYLYAQAIEEIDHGVDPVLITFKRKKKTFVTKFKEQFTAYAQGAFPFNKPLGKERPIDWWRTLEGTEHGGILASLALKLYSAVPNSMADERTVSVITWMNPALRNQGKVDTIFSFAQIRGWYRDTRKNARPFPEVKFYNIERDIHAVDDEYDEMELDGDEADPEEELEAIGGPSGAASGAMPQKDWLDIPREVFASSGVLDLESGEVDLDSTLLEDILAESPVATRGPSVNSGAGRMEVENVDDSDEEMMPVELGPWA